MLPRLAPGQTGSRPASRARITVLRCGGGPGPPGGAWRGLARRTHTLGGPVKGALLLKPAHGSFSMTENVLRVQH